MILSQEYKKKHYFFLSRKLVVCFLISITLNNTYAQVQRGKKDDAKAELISFKDRWGIKTNAVIWLLTVPNIGVEFDLGNTIRNKRTIGANIKWNWNTSQKYTPSLIFNVFDARVEWRQYFRTRKEARCHQRCQSDDTSQGNRIHHPAQESAPENALTTGAYMSTPPATTLKSVRKASRVTPTEPASAWDIPLPLRLPQQLHRPGIGRFRRTAHTSYDVLCARCGKRLLPAHSGEMQKRAHRAVPSDNGHAWLSFTGSCRQAASIRNRCTAVYRYATSPARHLMKR